MAQVARHGEEAQANLSHSHASHDHRQPNIPHHDVGAQQPPSHVHTDTGASSIKDTPIAGSNLSAAEPGGSNSKSTGAGACVPSPHHAGHDQLPEGIKEKLVIHDVMPCDDIGTFEDDIHGPAFARPECTPKAVPHDHHLDHVLEDNHPDQCHEGVGERVEDMLPAVAGDSSSSSPSMPADDVVKDLPESIKELVADDDSCVVPSEAVEIFEDDIHGPALASPDHVWKVSPDRYLLDFRDDEECHEGAPEKVSWLGHATSPGS